MNPQPASAPAPTPLSPPHARALAARVGAGVFIQGERHSFHHRAAGKLLPGCAIAPARTFAQLVAALEADPARLGLMAVENSVAGALLTNYLLLEEHHLAVLAETYLRISHCVLARPGATLGDVRTVESHPMALAQCRGLFRAHGHLVPTETFDTAGAARAVAEGDDATRAALAPAWCAAAYGLEVLAEAVEDNPHNWTRFVLVAHADSPPGGDKTSVAFSLPHERGSLARALTALASTGASLTKIQSLPLVGKPWQYRFFADFVHPACARPLLALEALGSRVADLIHLGTYAAGQHHQA